MAVVHESIDHNKNKCCPGIQWQRAEGRPRSCGFGGWDASLPVPALGPCQAVVAVAVAATLCFGSSVHGDFVFDDSEAIVNNGDLSPETPWWNVFYNDFWGTRLTHNNSHKSYRPLTVLSFRLNYLLSGKLHPWGFHLINIILHSVISAISIPVFTALLDANPVSRGPYVSRSAFVCALLFAVHPIHTESVAGIVGRADLLCALFFFLSFLLYVRATNPDLRGCRPSRFSLPLVVASMFLCAVSMLCKEQGITAIGLCSAYDIFITCQIDILEILGLQSASLSNLLSRILTNPVHNRFKSSDSSSTCTRMDIYQGYSCLSHSKTGMEWLRPLFLRHLILLIAGILMLFLRWHIMGSSPPTFQQVDNPASFAKTFYERTINYNYVYSLNAWLLVAPVWLCFDWSMGCIPLISSALDVRILAVLIFWLVLGALINAALFRVSSRERRIITMALAILIVPFMPASNLFFRVGFVIAERVLYVSTAGFCMLFVLGIQKLNLIIKKAKIIQVSLGFLILTFIVRCNERSQEWMNEETIFRSGLTVCPLNAKVHYNIAKNAADAGNKDIAIQEYREAIRLNQNYDQAMNNLANILKDHGQLEEAEDLLHKAISLRTDFAAAWMNLGIVQSTLKKHDAAERNYIRAISYRHRYPDCYYNLGNLYLDQGRYDDAYKAWRNATFLKPSHTVSWNNMIIMLDSRGYLDEAEAVGLEALNALPHEPSLHFNLANALGKAGRFYASEEHFLKAIQLNKHNPTYFANLGVLYHRWKKYNKAEEAYRQALILNPAMKSARDNLNLLLRVLQNNL